MPVQGKHAKADSTMKSRMLPWLVAAMIACALIVAQTLSVITREMPLETKIRFGDVDIETQILVKNDAGEEIAASDGEQLGAGSSHIQRIVRVKNTGDHPVFVRVQLQFMCTDAKGETHDIGHLVEYTRENSADSAGPSWVRRAPDDGFFYFGAPLGEGELSEPLITGLEIDTTQVTDQFGKDCTYRLVVKGAGVQSENQKTTDVLDAEGWPAQ